MAVNLKPPGDLPPVQGIRLGTAEAAIKAPGRKDLALLEMARGSRVAAVFTRNAFCAAPVTVCRELLDSGRPVCGLLINSGNANAGTGRQGLEAARQTALSAVVALDREGEVVLPFSTGVIGVQLPARRLQDALPAAAEGLAADNWLQAARAIMTTDTVPKAAARSLEIGGRRIQVTGIAKGAGMIRPDMATMLAFVACDAAIADDALQALWQRVVDRSFNCATVDGDTSTNDAAVLVASGAAGGDELAPGTAEFEQLETALGEVCIELAQALVRDGEGATKLVTVCVDQAIDEAEARQVAYTIAHSPLVKTALFASDANWGRILAAVGRSGLADLDLSRVDLSVDEVALIQSGEPHPDYSEARGSAVFSRDEFTIRVGLGRGTGNCRIWTCDLGHDYVRINAEYRT